MPTIRPYSTLLNEILRLPPPVLRWMQSRGIFSIEIEAYLHLIGSDALAGFPSAIRKLRARDMVRGFMRGKDAGSHEPGFYPYLVSQSDWPTFPDLALRDGMAIAGTVYPVLARGATAPATPAPKLALHIHCYYLDGLAGLRRAIEVNRSLPELFLTTTAAQTEDVARIFAGYGAAFTIRTSPNIGRDILPFLQLLPELLARDFALIGHVHIKRSQGNKAAAFARQWNRYTIGSLIGDAGRKVAAIDDICADWSGQPDTALYLPHNMNPVGWAGNRALAEDLRRQLNAKGTDLPELPDRPLFSVGTMFWGTPAYLAVFTKIEDDWPVSCKEPLGNDGTILHAIERLFGALAQARGARTVICPPVDTRLVLSARVMAKMKLPREQG